MQLSDGGEQTDNNRIDGKRCIICDSFCFSV